MDCCEWALESAHCHCNSGCYTVDRKSTRLNSSHSQISYAVFCLKKKKNNIISIGSLFKNINGHRNPPPPPPPPLPPPPPPPPLPLAHTLTHAPPTPLHPPA